MQLDLDIAHHSQDPQKVDFTIDNKGESNPNSSNHPEDPKQNEAKPKSLLVKREFSTTHPKEQVWDSAIKTWVPIQGPSIWVPKRNRFVEFEKLTL